jgi:asparagine synthase (glutamine-hydrolysing)
MEGLVDVLGRAVDERLRRAAGRVGCMLSGGMDSGSVAALAHGLLRARDAGPLRTFSAARGPGDGCDETRRIHATVDMLGANATILTPDAIAEHDAELAASIEDPFDGGFLFMKAIFLAARDAGMTALLDGGAGDVVLNASSHVTRLIRQGKLPDALREILAERSFWGGPVRPRDLANHILKAATPDYIKRTSRPWRQRASARQFVESSLISRDLARQVDIEARCERMWSMFPVDWTEDPALERIRNIRPNVSAGRERYARLARFAGLETRDPFLDLNVVKYCAQIPGHLLLRDGWPKWILRQAMADRLPDQVRWGRGRPHVGWIFSERFLRRELVRGSLSLERLRSSLYGRVDDTALELGWRSFLARSDYEAVERAYVLSLWLDQVANRPIAKNQPLGYSHRTGNGSAKTGYEIS